ncbi:hypothetical protein TW95_gp1397 [Pandoravirus inopinatum]|uniref:Transmembrane protein n=1 Tax=Pandoravirus inopinatum TaxID=1605721 RepID=A0A0B5JAV6_9VIRU|nr:hypothetical protein TW95_gp1397 [Pandoravirus inopinatum]AJF98131.1 hypothetical protein [Pandoravirus inopinatum]
MFDPSRFKNLKRQKENATTKKTNVVVALFFFFLVFLLGFAYPFFSNIVFCASCCWAGPCGRATTKKKKEGDAPQAGRQVGFQNLCGRFFIFFKKKGTPNGGPTARNSVPGRQF